MVTFLKVSTKFDTPLDPKDQTIVIQNTLTEEQQEEQNKALTSLFASLISVITNVSDQCKEIESETLGSKKGECS